MSDDHPEFVISVMTLRRVVGIAGFLLPLVVRLGGLLTERLAGLPTISAYYYTSMRDVFVGTLVCIGVLLACYRSPVKYSSAVAVLGGVGAVGIGLFPMRQQFAQDILEKYTRAGSAECYLPAGPQGFHALFVTLFFACALYLVSYDFPRYRSRTAGGERSFDLAQVRRRERVYAWCAALMLLGLVGLVAFPRVGLGGYEFWPEALAVMAFAVAWLVKGQVVLSDRP